MSPGMRGKRVSSMRMPTVKPYWFWPPRTRPEVIAPTLTQRLPFTLPRPYALGGGNAHGRDERLIGTPNFLSEPPELGPERPARLDRAGRSDRAAQADHRGGGSRRGDGRDHLPGPPDDRRAGPALRADQGLAARFPLALEPAGLERGPVRPGDRRARGALRHGADPRLPDKVRQPDPARGRGGRGLAREREPPARRQGGHPRLPRRASLAAGRRRVHRHLRRDRHA